MIVLAVVTEIPNNTYKVLVDGRVSAPCSRLAQSVKGEEIKLELGDNVLVYFRSNVLVDGVIIGKVIM